MAVCFRAANYHFPFWVSPNRSAARFNRAGEGPTQYLCLHPLGPFAELLRSEDVRHEQLVSHYRYRIWAVEVELEELVRVDFTNCTEHGIAPVELVGDDHSPCRDLAGRARSEGWAGMIVPSAALPGTESVILFGERASAPYGAERIERIDLPVSIAAHDGRAVRSLVARVRYRGEPHPALVALEQGERYEFVEPDWRFEAN